MQAKRSRWKRRNVYKRLIFMGFHLMQAAGAYTSLRCVEFFAGKSRTDGISGETSIQNLTIHYRALCRNCNKVLRA
jgi:hypothetical protein